MVKKAAQAQPLYLRVLAIREKVLGTEHPDTIATREHYDDLLEKFNYTMEAPEPACKERGV